MYTYIACSRNTTSEGNWGILRLRIRPPRSLQEHLFNYGYRDFICASSSVQQPRQLPPQVQVQAVVPGQAASDRP